MASWKCSECGGLRNNFTPHTCKGADCRHPVLYDDPKQPGVNIYLCARCDAEFKVNEFEVRRAGLETGRDECEHNFQPIDSSGGVACVYCNQPAALLRP
jgi:DNA-directed RNA polymerase subunit RPC12/RpoP